MFDRVRKKTDIKILIRKMKPAAIPFILDQTFFNISMSDFFMEDTEEKLENSTLLRTIYRLSSYQRELLLQFIESITDDARSK